LEKIIKKEIRGLSAMNEKNEAGIDRLAAEIPA